MHAGPRRTSMLTLLLLALAATAQAASDQRTISVGGEATVNVVPDLAYAGFSVERRNASMRAARDATVRVSSEFLALCKRLGIKPTKVSTSGLSIQPEYRWDEPARQQVFTGYFVQRQLEVQLDDLEKLGELIEGAIDIGITQASPPRLDSSRRRALQREALAAAAADAEASARQIAETLKVRLGPLRSLSADGAAPPPMPLMQARAMAMEADSSAAASYQPGELRLEARVNATFDVIAE